MRCSHCGAEVAEGSAVCSTCGISLSAGGNPAPGQPNFGPPSASIVVPDRQEQGGASPAGSPVQWTRPLPAPGAAPTQDRPDPRPMAGETIAAAPPAGWSPPPAPAAPAAPYGGAPAPSQGAYSGGQGHPAGGAYPPPQPPYGPATGQPGGPYGAPAGPPAGNPYGQAPAPGWTPGQPYPGQYPYPPTRPTAGLLSTAAGRAMVLLAAGGLLFWVFSFLPWISVSVPGRDESSSYKDVIDDLNLSNGYLMVMFLVGAVAFAAAALRWRTLQAGDPIWARMLMAGAIGAAVIVTILQFLQHGDLSDRLKASADPQVRTLIEVGMGLGLFLLPVACALMAAALWLDRPTSAPMRR